MSAFIIQHKDKAAVALKLNLSYTICSWAKQSKSEHVRDNHTVGFAALCLARSNAGFHYAEGGHSCWTSKNKKPGRKNEDDRGDDGTTEAWEWR